MKARILVDVYFYAKTDNLYFVNAEGPCISEKTGGSPAVFNRG